MKSYLSKKNYNVQICTFDETIFKNNTARYPDPPQNLTLQSIINILINQHLFHYLHPYMRKPNGKQITVWGGTSPACTNFYHLFQRTQHDAFFPHGHRFPSKQKKTYSWKSEWWYSKVTNFTVKLIMKVGGDGKVC